MAALTIPQQQAELNDKLVAFSSEPRFPVHRQDYFHRHLEPTASQSIEHTPLRYYEGLKQLLCSDCRVVVKHGSWKRHMHDKHKELFAGLAGKRAGLAGQLEGKAAVEREKSRMEEDIERQLSALEFGELAADSIEPCTLYLDCLPVKFDGYACRECWHAEKDYKRMRQHYGKAHGGVAVGSNKRAEYLIRGVPLQCLEGFWHNEKHYIVPLLPAGLDGVDEEGRRRLLDDLDKAESVAETGESREYSLAAADLIEEYGRSKKREKTEAAKRVLNQENEKLLGVFMRNSRVNQWLTGKNADILVDMVSGTESCQLDKLLEQPLTGYEDKVRLILQHIHDDGIENMSRGFRQALKTADRKTVDKHMMKDLVKLQNPAFYWHKGQMLVRFVLRVVLVRQAAAYEQEAWKFAEYSSFVNGLNLSSRAVAAANRLLELGDGPLDWAEDSDAALEFYGSLSELWMALLEEKILNMVTKNTAFGNTAISFFFCYILDKETKQVRKVGYCNNVSSCLIFCFRLMFVCHCWVRETRAGGGVDELSGQYSEQVIQELDKVLSINSGNCFEELCMLRSYGGKLAADEVADDYEMSEVAAGVFSYNTARFEVQGLKEFLHDILGELEECLRKELLMVDRLDNIGLPFDDIVDPPSNTDAGLSLLDSEQLQQYLGWFLRRLLKPGTAYNRKLLQSFRPGEPVVLKTAATERWLQAFNRFAELLAVAVNVTTGGPLRGTELQLLTYRNTTHVPRSLRYDRTNRSFLISSGYHKSYNVTRKRVLNQRLTPPRLSYALAYWIVLVLPFRDWIWKNHLKEDGFSNDSLFPRGKTFCSTMRISTRLQLEAGKKFEQTLTIQMWRKLINFIIKVKLDFNTDLDGSDESGDEQESRIEDRQANRSTRTSENHYMPRVMSLANVKNLNRIRLLSAFSNAYFNFFGLTDEAAVQLDGEEGGRKELEVQTTMYSHESLLASLRAVVGSKKAEFTSKQQEQCVSLVEQRQPVVTYVNRTGSGKSMAYLIPAHRLGNRLLVVVSPRVSLREDLLERARKLGVKAASLNDEQSFDCKLVIVSVEDLGGKQLERRIHVHKDEYKRHVTFFFDEAHLYVMEEKFRLCMREVSTVRKQQVSLVFLTATLPVPLQRLLEEAFGVRRKNVVVRGNSHRPDIAYKRRYFRAGEADGRYSKLSVLKAVIGEIEGEAGSSRGYKCLLFVNSIAEGKELAEELGVEFVYSSRKGYLQVLQDFLQDEVQWLLATTSVLEVGLDLKQIQFTIYLEPYRMTSLVQACGRIRQRGSSFILCKQPSKWTRANTKQPADEMVEAAAKKYKEFERLDKLWCDLFAVEDSCLRLPISRAMDNVSRRCNVDVDQLCSICSEREDVIRQHEREEKGKRNATAGVWLELERRLQDLDSEICLHCLLDEYSQPNSYHHAVRECRRLQEHEDVAVALAKAKELEPPKNAGCMGCLVPMNICTKWQQQNNIEGSCLVKDSCRRVLAVLAVHRRAAALSFGAAGEWDSENAVFASMMRPAELAGLRTIQLFVLLADFDVVRVAEQQEGERRELEQEQEQDVDFDVAGGDCGGLKAEQYVAEEAAHAAGPRELHDRAQQQLTESSSAGEDEESSSDSDISDEQPERAERTEESDLQNAHTPAEKARVKEWWAWWNKDMERNNWLREWNKAARERIRLEQEQAAGNVRAGAGSDDVSSLAMQQPIEVSSGDDGEGGANSDYSDAGLDCSILLSESQRVEQQQAEEAARQRAEEAAREESRRIAAEHPAVIPYQRLGIERRREKMVWYGPGARIGMPTSVWAERQQKKREELREQQEESESDDGEYDEEGDSDEDEEEDSEESEVVGTAEEEQLVLRPSPAKRRPNMSWDAAAGRDGGDSKRR